MLMQMLVGTLKRLFHSCICRQAERSTALPSGWIRPVSSASGDKDTRRDRSMLRVAPSQKRLEAADLYLRKVHDRLVVYLQLATVQRIAQVAFQLQRRNVGTLIPRLYDLVSAPALFPCFC